MDKSIFPIKIQSQALATINLTIQVNIHPMIQAMVHIMIQAMILLTLQAQLCPQHQVMHQAVL